MRGDNIVRQPKISIIIPVYNVEEYLEQTIESILNQTLKDFELILIDDGSTDSSQDILKRYSDEYDKIKVIYQKNSGPSRARNRGIEAASGEYITFADSDDILPYNSLELRYNAAIEHNADLVIGATYKFNSKRKWPLKTHFVGEGKKDIRNNKEILWTVGPWNKIYKAEVIKDLKFPEGLKYAEDQVFVIQAYLNAKNIYAIDDVIYYYRMRDAESEDSLTQQVFNDSANVIRQLYDVWTMTCDNVDSKIENKYIRNRIKINYLNRLVIADMWPALKSSVISKNKDWQKRAFEYTIKLIEAIDKDVLNEEEKIQWIISRGITDKYLFIHKSNRKLYLKLLQVLFDKFDANTIYKLKKEHRYYVTYMEKAVKTNNTMYIYKFLAVRRLERLKKKLTREYIKKAIDKRMTKLCTKGVFKISKLLPIKRNKVILASNRSPVLEGNFKNINAELSNHKEFKMILYLQNNKKKKSYLAKQYFDFATAKYIILDDYYRQLYGYKFKAKAEIVQVWHACGAFKKFGFSSLGQGDSNSIKFEKNAHSHYTKVITSSENIDKHYAEAFNIDEDKVYNLGVPRTDNLLNSEYKEYMRLKLEAEYPSIVGKKIITYAPTFRGRPSERKNFKCELDYTKIVDMLDDDYVVILKLHPAVNENSVYIPEEYKDKVLNLTRYNDINDLLIITDVLISDYSSVIFEYALLEKPMIFFAYDLESYVDERNFYYNYEDFVPGPIVKTNDEIINLIKGDNFDLDKVRTFRNEFFEDIDGKSTERLVEFLIKGSLE